MLDYRQFLRSRQTLLQAVLWVVLGATVALAAIVDHSLRRGLFVSLTEPMVDGPVSFSLPAQWPLTSSRDEQSDKSVHTATDPAGAAAGSCTITVTRQRVDSIMTPVEYLHLSGQFTGKRAEPASETMMVDEWPGQWVQWSSRPPVAGEVGETRGIFFAVVLPTRQAISITLQRSGPLENRDTRLFKQIIDSMHISQRAGFGPIIMADGTRIAVPPDFVVYEQPDPLREDRTIVLRPSGGGWISMQFVGLLLNGEPGGDLRTALALHEGFDFRDPPETQRWLTARIDQEQATRWRIDPQDPVDHLLRRRAYVLGGPRNSALAVILTAVSPAGDDEIDSAWTEISSKIQFGDGVDIAPMLAAGAKAIAAAGSASRNPGSNWWLWTMAGTPVGWSHNGLTHDSGLPVRQTVRRNWEGTFTRLEQWWNFNENPSGTSAHTVRFDADVEPASEFGGTFEQYATAADALVIHTNVTGKPEPLIEIETPPAFVLGGRFPRLLASLPDNFMAIWTDRFPGLEDQLLEAPILLLVRPVDSPEPGLRCLEVRVNGTGWVSRWYFRADQTLDHASFPGELAMRAATQGEIESILAGDPHLTVR